MAREFLAKKMHRELAINEKDISRLIKIISEERIKLSGLPEKSQQLNLE